MYHIKPTERGTSHVKQRRTGEWKYKRNVIYILQSLYFPSSRTLACWENDHSVTHIQVLVLPFLKAARTALSPPSKVTVWLPLHAVATAPAAAVVAINSAPTLPLDRHRVHAATHDATLQPSLIADYTTHPGRSWVPPPTHHLTLPDSAHIPDDMMCLLNRRPAAVAKKTSDQKKQIKENRVHGR